MTLTLRVLDDIQVSQSSKRDQFVMVSSIGLARSDTNSHTHTNWAKKCNTGSLHGTTTLQEQTPLCLFLCLQNKQVLIFILVVKTRKHPRAAGVSKQVAEN